MPIRDRRCYGSTKVVGASGVTTTIQNTGLTLGEYKSISALNSAGVFVPGILRLNPVSIRTQFGYSQPATFSPKQSWSSYKEAQLFGDVACSVSQFGGPYGWDGLLLGPLAWNQSAADVSLQKAFSKACSPDLDVGIILGELRETVAGIANPLSALRKYIKQFNRLVYMKGGRGLVKTSVPSRPKMTDTLNMLSGSWLEWRYGITPLIITIESAIKHFQDTARTLEGKLLRAKGKVKVARKSTAYSYTTTLGALFSVRWNGVVETDVTTTSKLYYIADTPLTFAERYGFDILSAPGVALELVHLSFVVDWFFSVALWLDSIKFFLQGKRTIKGSCTSQRVSSTFKVLSCEAVLNPSVNSWYQTGSGFTMSLESLERRVNQTLPLIPAVNPASLSLQRQVDALTLAWQRMPKFRRK